MANRSSMPAMSTEITTVKSPSSANIAQPSSTSHIVESTSVKSTNPTTHITLVKLAIASSQTLAPDKSHENAVEMTLSSKGRLPPLPLDRNSNIASLGRRVTES
jgi:hypothetical protein